jgi:glutathione synthase/RimK-type ligase-like ATP-grasp enzyme
MKHFIVVNDIKRWPNSESDVELVMVDALAYLTDPVYAQPAPARVYNLCDSYRYQSLGYYVSLLAEARGHRPLPRARTIEDLQSPNLVRLLTEPLDELIQHAFHNNPGDFLEWDFYCGQRTGQTDDVLGQQLFQLLKAPLLRAQFERNGQRWQIRSARALAVGDLDANAIEIVAHALQQHCAGRNGRLPKQNAPRYEIAILHDPEEIHPPSNPLALQKLAEAAETLGMHVEFIGHADYGRLSEFDGLFIRATTGVSHYTYRFARQAAAEGLVVIDDPDSILKCSNKVYLAELLSQRAIPAPKTLVVHRANLDQVFPTLGFPCIIKQPDSAFSLGVSKVSTQQELQSTAEALFMRTDLFVAQEYLPTNFDWRVGVLDGRALYVAKYFMAPGHWQIIKHGQSEEIQEGATAALSVGEAPDEVIQQALRAANCIGDGLYGVDVKQVGSHAYVIEVNDNPNLDAGNEDGVLKDALYREVMGVFLKRIVSRKRGVVV